MIHDSIYIVTICLVLIASGYILWKWNQLMNDNWRYIKKLRADNHMLGHLKDYWYNAYMELNNKVPVLSHKSNTKIQKDGKVIYVNFK